MKFDIGHMITTSSFTAVDSLDPIFHHSGTHFDQNVGNFALDVVPIKRNPMALDRMKKAIEPEMSFIAEDDFSIKFFIFFKLC